MKTLLELTTLIAIVSAVAIFSTSEKAENVKLFEGSTRHATPDKPEWATEREKEIFPPVAALDNLLHIPGSFNQQGED